MSDFLNRMAQLTGLPANVLVVLGVLLVLLVAGSAVRLALLLRSTDRREEVRSRALSLLTWWVLYVLLAAVVVLGSGAAIILFAGISLFGLREFRLLARERISPMHLWWGLAYLAVAIHYLLIPLAGFALFWIFIPVWVFCILLVRLVVTGQTSGFLETAGITFLGLMLIVFLLSHAVLILALPAGANLPAGTLGLFIYLIVLTETNDIAQALWGRQLGRRKITPSVSPGKTWEGFLLGAATTVAAAFALAGLLTPFAERPLQVGSVQINVPYLPALAAGVLIAVGGFFGDITMSAVKREVGVKDTGALLPGQGGVLDRIDSLIFTAPLFFYFTYLLYG